MCRRSILIGAFLISIMTGGMWTDSRVLGIICIQLLRFAPYMIDNDILGFVILRACYCRSSGW